MIFFTFSKNENTSRTKLTLITLIVISQLLLVLFSLFIFSTKTLAASPFAPSTNINSTGPTSGSGVFNGTTTVTPYYTIGKGQYDYGYQDFSVYVPENSGLFSVTIENAGHDCTQVNSGGVVGPDFGGAYSRFELYNGAGNITAAGNSTQGCTNLTLSAYANEGAQYPQGDPDKPSMRKFTVVARLRDQAMQLNGEWENAFRVIGSRSNVIVGLGSGNANGLGYRNTNLVNGNKWGVAVLFGTQPDVCNTRPAVVSWRDADPERTDWSNNMRFAIYYQRRDANPTDRIQWTLDPNTDLYQSNGSLLDNHTYQSRPNSGYDVDPNYRYMLVLENVGVRNTVQVQISGAGIDQLGSSRTRASTVCTPPLNDVCPNLPGIQESVPAGYTKNAQGDCVRTVTRTVDGVCNAEILMKDGSRRTGGGILAGSFDSVIFQVYNSGNVAWDENHPDPQYRNTVYVEFSGNPADIRVYGGRNRPPGPGTTIPALPQRGYNDQIFNVDGFSIGAQNYTLNLIRYTPQNPREILHSCSVGITIYDEPISDPNQGELQANCSSLRGGLIWRARGTPADGILYTSNAYGENYNRSVNGSNFGHPMNGWPGAPSDGRLRPEKPHDYRLVAFSTDGRQTVDAYASNSDCMTFSCLPSGGLTLPYNVPQQVRRGVVVTNNTALDYSVRANIRLDGGLTFYPGGSRGPEYVGGNPISSGEIATLTPELISTSRGYMFVYPEVDIGGGFYNAIMPNSFNCSDGSGPPLTVDPVFRPYVKTYFGDTVAGGGFGEVCTPASSRIAAYMRPLDQQRRQLGSDPRDGKGGSGSQLGSFAWGSITGFTSAMLRTTEPSSDRGSGLTFGGVGASTFSGLEFQYNIGGNLGGNAPCMPDYYNDTQFPQESTDRINATGNTINSQNGYDGKQVFYNGDARLNSLNNFSGRTTYYVDGDLYINGNGAVVNYKATYADITDIPNLTIVVRGNIYIDPRVERLDGTYIAQPRADNSGGLIYTCATEGRAYTNPSEMYNLCSGGYGQPANNVRRLTVNGSFVAKKVVLNRAVNDLDASRYREQSATSSAAEVFNFMPEVYLSPPVFKPNSTVTSGDYKSIAQLPPIF